MDIDPEKREGLLQAAALSGNEIVHGLNLRPVTSATWSLLARLGNSFVTGQKDDDYAWSVYSFVYLHSKPLADIRRKVATLDDLRGDIYEWMDTRPVEDVFKFVPYITRQIEQVAATITAIAPSGDASPKA
jgi:hypothetical protein